MSSSVAQAYLLMTKQTSEAPFGAFGTCCANVVDARFAGLDGTWGDDVDAELGGEPETDIQEAFEVGEDVGDWA